MAILKGVKTEVQTKITVSDEVVFMAYWRQMTRSERQEWREEVGELVRQTPEKLNQAKYMRQWLVRWEKMPAADGGEIEFNPDNVELVLDAIEYCDALYQQGFLAMVNGSAAAKN